MAAVGEIEAKLLSEASLQVLLCDNTDEIDGERVQLGEQGTAARKTGQLRVDLGRLLKEFADAGSALFEVEELMCPMVGTSSQHFRTS